MVLKQQAMKSIHLQVILNLASYLNLSSLTIPFGIAPNLYYVGITSTTKQSDLLRYKN